MFTLDKFWALKEMKYPPTGLLQDAIPNSPSSFSNVSNTASSEANVADIKAKLQWQTIGPDKINQLRHVRYFKDINGMKEYMNTICIIPENTEILCGWF